MEVVPVTILGGFLGAGKTTALNRLLREAEAGTVVLVNDFGAINVDGSLVAAKEGDLLTLANGCVCCSIGPDFSATLGRMLARRPAPRRIFIEASGVSDPWRIAQLVKLERKTRIAAVIVLADTLNFAIQAADRWIADTLARQVARADIVAMTKCDLADEKMKAAAQAAIREIRADVPIIEIAQGAIPLALLDTHADIAMPRFLADAPEHGFLSWYWSPSEALERQWLESVMEALPPSVLRVKGIVRLEPEARRHVVHMVGRRWNIEPWDRMAGEEGLVVIGTRELPAPEVLAATFSKGGDRTG